MSKPIIELIAENIEAAINEITTVVTIETLTVTGTLSPDITGTYSLQSTPYNDAAVYKHSAQDVWIWYDSVNDEWWISSVIGSYALWYFSLTGSGPNGLYEPSGTATGIATVAIATTSGGFNQILTAQRPRKIDFDTVRPRDLLCLIYQGEETKLEGVYNLQEWQQAFALVCFVVNSETSVDSIDTRINYVRADVVKKLMEDVTRGSYAIDTIIEASQKFNDGAGFTGITININVHYRTKIDDPYTQG